MHCSDGPRERGEGEGTRPWRERGASGHFHGRAQNLRALLLTSFVGGLSLYDQAFESVGEREGAREREAKKGRQRLKKEASALFLPSTSTLMTEENAAVTPKRWNGAAFLSERARRGNF